MQMETVSARENAESLFAIARRVLSGEPVAPPPPVNPIDLKSGIDRALRQTNRNTAAGDNLVFLAARAISVVEGTLVATDAIDACLSEAQDLVSHALAAVDPGARALFAERFIELVNRVDTIASGATFEGLNLINLGKDKIELVSPVGGQPRHAVGHIVLTASERGLGLKLPKNAFRDDAEIEAKAACLTRARARLIKAADTFLNQASMMAPYLEPAAAAAA